jgi:inner membrane protein
MDPLTQGVVGAIAAQCKSSPQQLAKAAIIGGLAGMAPDLDVLIHSSSDSLLSLEYHRQFTHSLIFIPIGALLCAVIFYWLLAKRWQLSFKTLYLFSLLGFATHGLLDSCTSYGTQLLWPFSHERIAWNIISIIDPMLTLPLLALLVTAVMKRQRRWVMASTIWASLYFALGVFQQQRAIDIGWQLAEQQQHQASRLAAKPSFGNLLVWKVIYETDQHFHVTAVRPGFAKDKIWPGDHVKKLDIDRDLPWLDKRSQQARDIARFNWFSAGFLSLDRHHPNRVVDMRYSMLPHEVKPLWGIKLSAEAEFHEHVEFYMQHEPRKRQQNLLRIWSMIWE